MACPHHCRAHSVEREFRLKGCSWVLPALTERETSVGSPRPGFQHMASSWESWHIACCFPAESWCCQKLLHILYVLLEWRKLEHPLVLLIPRILRVPLSSQMLSWYSPGPISLFLLGSSHLFTSYCFTSLFTFALQGKILPEVCF